MISFFLCFFVVLSVVLTAYAFMDQRKVRRYLRQRDCLCEYFNTEEFSPYSFKPLPRELVKVLDEIEGK